MPSSPIHDTHGEDLGERVAKLEATVAAETISQARQQVELDRRFREVNEFRNALSDLSRLMMPRTEYDARHNSLVAQVDLLRTAMDLMNSRIDRFEGGRSTLSNFTGWILSGIGVLVAIIVGWLAYMHGGK